MAGHAKTLAPRQGRGDGDEQIAREAPEADECDNERFEADVAGDCDDDDEATDAAAVFPCGGLCAAPSLKAAAADEIAEGTVVR